MGFDGVLDGRQLAVQQLQRSVALPGLLTNWNDI